MLAALTAPASRSSAGRRQNTAANLTLGAASLIFPASMADLRRVHQLMNDRRRVQLDDGRTGKIVRVDTFFPDGHTTVTVWTGPGVAKVDIERVVGPAPQEAKSA